MLSIKEISSKWPFRYSVGWRGPWKEEQASVAIREVHEWCAEQFGPMSDERWQIDRAGYFLFGNEHDAFVFKMRWC